MEILTYPAVAGDANESDLRSFRGSFVIRGVARADRPGFPGSAIVERGAVADTIELTTEAM